MIEIKVKIRNTYGVDRIYPQNFIKQLEDLTKQKTLTEREVKALKELGFTFKVVAESLPKI